MSLLVSSLYNIVDQIFIGRGVGYLGNGATNVVFPITVISLAIALMLGDGAAAYLSLCQGICPGRHILSCVYSEDRDTLCAITSPHHSNLLADETRILLFDVGNAKRVLLPEVLESKVVLSLVQNEDYIVAFTDLEMIAISTESFSVIDKKEWDSDHRYEIPVDVIVDKESFYPVFYGKETLRNGYMLQMSIENSRIQEYDCIDLPRIKIDEIDTPILIRQPRASSLCRIRALDKSEIVLSYTNSEGKTIEKTIEEWTPVYLEGKR